MPPLEPPPIHRSPLGLKSRAQGALDQTVHHALHQLVGVAQSENPYHQAWWALSKLLLLSAWEATGLLPPNALKESDANSLTAILLHTLHTRFGITTSRWTLTAEAAWLPPAAVSQEILATLGGQDLTPLGQTDQLGFWYQSSLSRAQRKTLGQFYTPPLAARFLMERLEVPDQLAKVSPDKPFRIYDPAAGAGAFLLATAWQMMKQESKETLFSLKQTLYGSEKDPLALALCETSLLLLCTPQIARRAESFAPAVANFGLVVADSLSFFQGSAFPPQGSDEPSKDTVSLMGGIGWADACLGNPPYVGEKGNKELFRNTLEQYPQWKPYYQGRMDYQYFFFLLGLEKLREGGRLGFITTRYWLTADGASGLRQALLEQCLVKELIDLSEVRLFDQAAGQHNLMVVLEKCSDAQQRAQHRPKWISLKGGVLAPGGLSHAFLDQDEAQNTWATVQTLPSSQAALAQATHSAWSGWRPSAGTSVESILESLYTRGVPLEKLLQDQQGVISGADRVTSHNWTALSPGWPEEQGIRIGDGIFCLTPQELEALNLEPEAMGWVKPFFKNSHLTRYGIDQTLEKAERLLYIHRDCPVEAFPNLYRHLSRFRPLLERKRECQTGKIPWYCLHWPRNQRLLEAPALVTARRAPNNRFAIAEAGWYENSDLTLLVPREGPEEWLYFYLGLLNSRVLNFWNAHRGKPKGKLFEYYATPIRQIPLCPPEKSPPQTETLISLTKQACQRQADWLRQRSPNQPEHAPELAALQEAIDQQVYALYELTQEQITALKAW